MIKMINNNFFYLTVISIFAVPLSGYIPLPNTDIWYVEYLALFFLLMGGISIFLLKFNKWLALFSFLALCSVVLRDVQNPRSLLILTQLNLSFLASYFISTFNSKQRKILFYCLIGVCFIQFIIVTLQFFNIEPAFESLSDSTKDDAVGLSGSFNQISLWWAVTTPLLMMINPFLIIINIFGLFLAHTTAGWIAFIGSAMIYTFMTNKKIFVYLLLLLLTSSYIFFKHYESIGKRNISERIELIKHSINEIENGTAIMKNNDKIVRIKANRWFGFGLGNFIRISPYTQYNLYDKFLPIEKPSHVYEHVHNDLVEIWYELGRTGFIISIIIILKFLKDFIKAKKTQILIVCFCAILAHLIASMGIYTVQTALSGMLLIIFYGIFMGEIKNGKITNNS